VRLCRNKEGGGEGDEKLSLGKLGEHDYFGETRRGRYSHSQVSMTLCIFYK
jgi:hypothetical protein